MNSMGQVWQSNRHVGNICELTTLSVAGTSVLATFGAPGLYWLTGVIWLSFALPAAAIAAAVIIATAVQHRAVARHKELCAALTATWQ